MEVLDAYKIFGGTALAIASGLVGYLLRRNTHEIKIEGRVGALENWQQVTQKCIDNLKADEGENAIRRYRQEENDKQMAELKAQITSGFAAVTSEVTSVKYQIVELIAKNESKDATVNSVIKRIDALEAGTAEMNRVLADLRAERRKDDTA